MRVPFPLPAAFLAELLVPAFGIGLLSGGPSTVTSPRGFLSPSSPPRRRVLWTHWDRFEPESPGRPNDMVVLNLLLHLIRVHNNCDADASSTTTETAETGYETGPGYEVRVLHDMDEDAVARLGLSAEQRRHFHRWDRFLRVVSASEFDARLESAHPLGGVEVEVVHAAGLQKYQVQRVVTLRGVEPESGRLLVAPMVDHPGSGGAPAAPLQMLIAAEDAALPGLRVRLSGCAVGAVRGGEVRMQLHTGDTTFAVPLAAVLPHFDGDGKRVGTIDAVGTESSETDDHSWPRGARVTVRGLTFAQGAPLNGREGVLEGFVAPSQRLRVALDVQGQPQRREFMSLKPENIDLAGAPISFVAEVVQVGSEEETRDHQRAGGLLGVEMRVVVEEPVSSTFFLPLTDLLPPVDARGVAQRRQLRPPPHAETREGEKDPVLAVLGRAALPEDVWLSFPRSALEAMSRKQRESDLLRLALLEHFGGLWVDASTVVARPFSEWEEAALRSQDGDLDLLGQQMTPQWLAAPQMPALQSYFLATPSARNGLVRRWLLAFVSQLRRMATALTAIGAQRLPAGSEADMDLVRRMVNWDTEQLRDRKFLPDWLTSNSDSSNGCIFADRSPSERGLGRAGSLERETEYRYYLVAFTLIEVLAAAARDADAGLGVVPRFRVDTVPYGDETAYSIAQTPACFATLLAHAMGWGAQPQIQQGFAQIGRERLEAPFVKLVGAHRRAWLPGYEGQAEELFEAGIPAIRRAYARAVGSYAALFRQKKAWRPETTWVTTLQDLSEEDWDSSSENSEGVVVALPPSMGAVEARETPFGDGE